MSENSKIEWTDHTFNPWEGCQKIGPGCDHCYAEARNARFAGGTPINWGPGAPRRRTSASNWRKPLQWNAKPFFECPDCRWRGHEAGSVNGVPTCPNVRCASLELVRTRPRVFCASLADVFDNEVDPAWRRDLFDLIELTPNLNWLLFTKRIGNVRAMASRAKTHDWLAGRVNVWLGATIVNREEMLRDAEKLLAVPARVRFWSVEPMLADLGEIPAELMPDWVICGGESGPDARPMHPDWARSLRDRCAAANVPFLFKQWGEWKPISEMSESETTQLYRPNRVAGEFEDQGVLDELYGRTCRVSTDAIGYGGARGLENAFRVVEDANGRQRGGMQVFKVGKKAAGRQLDGRTHDEFPRGAA